MDFISYTFYAAGIIIAIVLILYLFSEKVLCGREILNDCDGSKRSLVEALEKWNEIRVKLEEKYGGRNIITKRIYLTSCAQWCVDYEVGEKIKYEDMEFIDRN